MAAAAWGALCLFHRRETVLLSWRSTGNVEKLQLSAEDRVNPSRSCRIKVCRDRQICSRSGLSGPPAQKSTRDAKLKSMLMRSLSHVRRPDRSGCLSAGARVPALGLGYVLRRALVSFVACILAIVLVQPVVALEIEFSGRKVKRDIIALYDGRRERLPHETRIHKFAEMPLNYLGYRVIYQDVNARLPDAATLGHVQGVVTWFVEPLRRPEAVVDWLDALTARGIKLVVLGEVAPPDAAAMLPSINRILARIGLEHTGEYVDLTWRAFIVEQNPDLVGFERPIDKALPGYSVLRTKGTDVEPHLLIEGPAAGGGRVTATVVATGPGGGFASQNYTVYYEPNTDRVRWTLNPFAFFKRALGSERYPIPDTTTLSGRRIYFSHIDGDGWNNLSEIEGHKEAQRFSADVIAREAIIPYPDLPVTVGIIAGDVSTELGGNPAGRTVARQIYALPQVEVGSHTYTHPYAWQFYETYDRSAEEAKIKEYRPPDQSTRERVTEGIAKLSGKSLPNTRYNPYVAGTDDLPRTYLRNPFDLDLEIGGALRVSESLAPAGRKAKAYLWSGDTTPFPDAIREVRRNGAHNINGGDSRLDREYPSVTYVPPISRPARSERQIYAANSNENTYTNDWTGPYYGFMMLEHTLANTERPRRLKPFNLYYHMYSGEKPASLAAVKKFLELARNSPVVPISAAHYSELADDFFTAEIEQVDLFSWAVTSRGLMQTVRFDASEFLVVDMERSAGVLGSNRRDDGLYVTLDAAVKGAIVTLRSRSEAEKGVATPRRGPPADLIESRWLLSDYAGDGCGFRVNAQGYGPGEMVWQTTARKGFRVAANRSGTQFYEEAVRADADGVLRFRIDASAIEPLTLRFACHE